MAKPNRDSAEIIFEIIGKVDLEVGRYWIAAKHLPSDEFLKTLEVNIALFDEDGHSVPSNLGFSPQLEWKFTKQLKANARY